MWQAIWPTVVKEYLAGGMTVMIARKHGLSEKALTARIVRAKLPAVREKAIAAAQKKAVAAGARSLQSSSATTYVNRVKVQVERGIGVLEENTPTFSTIERHARSLETLDRIGRRAYGLDESGEGKRVTLNLTMLAQEVKEEAVDAEFEPELTESCPAILDVSEGDGSGLEPATE
ncbi:MAG: hypothetical protein ABI162_06880 [Luteolibacter sp.]